MKKVLLCLLLVLALCVASCKKDDGKPSGDGEQVKIDQELDASLKNSCKDKKIYLTTCGQADIETVYSLFESVFDDDEELTTQKVNKKEMLKASEVDAGSVVFLVVGTSGKGLGSAGTSVPDETNRAKAFSDAAKAGTFTVVLIHVGGEGRRGSQSDPVIRAAVPGAKAFLVKYDDGKVDSDGVITAVAKDASVPLYFYSGAAKMANPIKALLGL